MQRRLNRIREACDWDFIKLRFSQPQRALVLKRVLTGDVRINMEGVTLPTNWRWPRKKINIKSYHSSRHNAARCAAARVGFNPKMVGIELETAAPENIFTMAIDDKRALTLPTKIIFETDSSINTTSQLPSSCEAIFGPRAWDKMMRDATRFAKLFSLQGADSSQKLGCGLHVTSTIDTNGVRSIRDFIEAWSAAIDPIKDRFTGRHGAYGYCYWGAYGGEHCNAFNRRKEASNTTALVECRIFSGTLRPDVLLSRLYSAQTILNIAPQYKGDITPKTLGLPKDLYKAFLEESLPPEQVIPVRSYVHRVLKAAHFTKELDPTHYVEL